MSYLIIDIETSAKPTDQLNMPEFEASKVLKDPEKIKVDIENKLKEWIDQCALFADRGRVLVIGVLGSDSKSEMIEGDEKEILINFWTIWSGETCSIVGHNIKSFDMPFLMRRSWLNGVKVPSGVMEGRYMSRRVLDTMDAWACGVYNERISLDNLSKAFGLNGKNGHGKEFASKYLSGEDGKKEALEYLKNDLKLTEAVAKGMGLIR